VASPAPEKAIIFDTQNEVKPLIKLSSNASGRITINATGNFDSANFEVGYLLITGDDTSFEIYTDAVTTSDGGYELATGSNRDVFGRATGASPSISVRVQNVS